MTGKIKIHKLCFVILIILLAFNLNSTIAQELMGKPMSWMSRAKAGISQAAWEKIPAIIRPLMEAPKEFLDMQAKMIEVHQINTNEPVIGILVKSRGNRGQLEAIGAKVGSQFEDIFTLRIPISRLGELAENPNILSIEPSVIHHLDLDLSIKDSKADLVHKGDYNSSPPIYFGYSGEDVLVATLDSGIDWDHDDFINDSDGTSRILFIWDQTLIAQDNERPPAGYNYGVEYTQAHINNEIDGTPAGFVRTIDTIGHGTHVMGIIAGDGSSTNGTFSPYTYVGMAPKVDMIVIKSTLYTSDLLDGVAYALAKAEKLGKPIVINLSIGNHIGAHDGSSLAEQAYDNAIGTGKVIVVSAGNEGTDSSHGEYIHAEGTVRTGSSDTTTFIVPSYNTNSGSGNDLIIFDMWYQGQDNLNVKVISPDGYTYSKSSGYYGGYDSYDGLIYIDNASDGNNINNGDRECLILIFDYHSYRPPEQGMWKIVVSGSSISESGHYDAWIAGSQLGSHYAFFSATSGDISETISIPGTAERVITVGAHSTKESWRDYSDQVHTFEGNTVNDIAYFSSVGPTREDPGYITGMQKPDISAPGFGVISALSTDASHYYSDPKMKHYRNEDGNHVMMAGTSMSAPHVAGAVALLFSKNETLSASEIKSILRASAAMDSYTGSVPNFEWGFGKLDAYSAVQNIPSSPDYFVNITPSFNKRTAAERFSVTYPLVIRNLGLYNDRYNLTLTDNLWYTTIWDSTGTNQIRTSGLIHAGSNLKILVKVVIPDGTSYGFTDSVTLQASSVSDPTVKDFAKITTKCIGQEGNLPWSDSFPSFTLNSTQWVYNSGFATVSSDGINEPSPSYSLNLDGVSSGGDEVHSQAIDLSGFSRVILSYYYQRTGNANSPEDGDDLWVEYYNSSGQWINIKRYLGSGPNMNSYIEERIMLPSDAYHAGFRIRFLSSGGLFSSDADDWFIDDVYVYAGPEIAVTSDSILATLNLGDSTKQTLTISNTGEGDLYFTISKNFLSANFSNSWLLEPARRNYPESYFARNLQKGEHDNRKGPAILLGSGGPDNFGYYWIDSDEPGGPAFQWEDISSIGTQITSIGDDRNVGPYPIGFSFPFYGQDFTAFQFSTNGFISFTSTLSASRNDPIPNEEVYNLVATFWDDLDFSSGGTAFYYYDGDKLIIQYSNVPHYSSGGPYTFEIFLYPDGNIKFQYLSMVSRMDEATIGIQNGDGTDGLEIAFNASYVHDNLAILISPAESIDWLTVTPSTGTVVPQDNLDVVVKLSTTGEILSNATYNANLKITSNDPVNSVVTVPVEMTVNPVPYYVVVSPSEQRLTDFPGDMVVYTLTIKNYGENEDSYGLIISYNNWPTTVLDITGSNQITSISPVASDSAVDITVRVEIPDNTFSGAVDTCRIKVSSSGDPTVSDIAMVITTAYLPIPWFDSFPTTEVDSRKWPYNQSAVVNSVGLNEPSPSYSLNLDGTDEVRSETLDFSGLSDLVLSYYYEKQGGGDLPEAGDDLWLEYYDSTNNWVSLNQHLGGGSGMTSYDSVGISLPGAAYHSEFSFRFRTTCNSNYDDWFIDDVLISVVDTTQRFWADIDGDHDVDVVDIQIVAGKWNTKIGEPNYDPKCDVDNEGQGDGDIDIVDIQLVAGWWNKPLPPGAWSTKIIKASEDVPASVKLKVGSPVQNDESVGSHYVDLIIENVLDLAAFQFNVGSRDKTLRVDKIELGGFLKSTRNKIISLGPEKDTNQNNFTFGAFSYGKSSGVSGSGVLARIRFSSSKDGVLPIELARFMATDINGKLIPIEKIVYGSGLEQQVSAIPKTFALSQNYPNPFNPTTKIDFDIPDKFGKPVRVKLYIFNLRGQLVRTLMDEEKVPGSYSIQWNGTNDRGQMLSSGIYFYSMVAGDFKVNRRMILVR